MALVLIIAFLALVAIYVVAANLIARSRGYSIPGRTVVRCRQGHLFTTTWIMGGSLKALRLGPMTRYQYCPVGQHWAIVHPVKDGDLSAEERQLAAAAST